MTDDPSDPTEPPPLNDPATTDDDQPRMDDDLRDRLFARLDELAMDSILKMAADPDADPQVKLKAFNTAAAWVKSRGKVKPPPPDTGMPVGLEAMRKLMDESHRKVINQNARKTRQDKAREKAVRKAAGDEVVRMDGDAQSSKLQALIDQLAQES